jgi:hypothetical protein
MEAVGNWAERRNIAYSGYADLAAQTDVIHLIADCVEKVNADLANDSLLATSQIHRFIVLHKELDPDDDELTRTRKVRRGFIAEKYAILIDALYTGKARQFFVDQGLDNSDTQRWWFRLQLNMRRSITERAYGAGKLHVLCERLESPQAFAIYLLQTH